MDPHEIQQTDRKLRKKFAGIRKKFGSIRNHLKGLTFSVILLGNRIISGEYAANINVLHSQDIRHCVRLAQYSQRHTNDRECLRTPTNIWRSFCDHCDWWRIAFVSPFAIYSPLSGEFAANIFFYIRKDIRHSARLALTLSVRIHQRLQMRTSPCKGKGMFPYSEVFAQSA